MDPPRRNAARASVRVADHVGRLMQERGVSAEDAGKALAPNKLPEMSLIKTNPPKKSAAVRSRNEKISKRKGEDEQ